MRSCALLAGLASGSLTCAHEGGPLGEHHLAWHTPQISRVTSSLFPGEVRNVNGKNCVAGGNLSFNVRDEFAFDIDEDVQLTIDFVLPEGSSSTAKMTYEKSGTGTAVKQIELPGEASTKGVHNAHITLDRARFANNGAFGSDFSIAADWGKSLIICGVALERSYTTVLPKAYGRVDLHVTDEHNLMAPVRIGIYDARGRLLLPSSEAVPVRRFSETTRVINWAYPSEHGSSVPWPVANQSAFYINGHYRSRLPVGRYEVLISKGPEYRIARKSFSVLARATTAVQINLVRWDNLRVKGWYSGDDHVHYERAGSSDDANLLLMTQAEDIQVASILQMGNVASTYYRQYNWKAVADSRKTSYVLVPGQEDPRTLHRGHTLHLNLKEPVRDPLRYLLYHEVFERTRAQGAVVGYAHASDGYDLGARRGLALDMPFGLVDFVEVLQFGEASTRTWFDYLNLGYKLSPSAGSDYPYEDQLLGAVRSYVYAEPDQTFTPQAWFDGLKQGRTFVTNGPMLEVTANQQGMGSELQLQVGDALSIRVKATINPDVDLLDRIELIEQGEVIKTVSSKEGASELRLDLEVPVRRGTWFVVRAQGKREKEHASIVALSAPIYVRVADQSFWKAADVPEIIHRVKEDLKGLLNYQPFDTELFETYEPNTKVVASQVILLNERVQQAGLMYDDLAARARHSSGAN